ncbi:Na+ dependent nucleoside transporter C-terminus-domain-containing protein [Suillus subluteus]|nr:Na+ dependent nucleoside transporter C-terminus-domain-containing protein [Suillus subluteus]
MAAPAGGFDAENQFIQRKTSVDTNSDGKQETAPVIDAGGDLEGAEEKDEGTQARDTFNKRLRVVILIALAALILGWWISSTILTATRGQWLVQTVFACATLFAFRFIPNSVVTEPITAVPWYKLPRQRDCTIGWLCLLGIVFGSAFGFPLTGNSNYGNRAISVLGLFVFQCGFYLCSTNRSAICWPTVIVGLFLQQTIALFVLKTGAGFSFFKYIADLADDFLSQADVGAEFFFDAETIAKGWFFVNVLSAVIFFIATIQMLYYLGVMQWMVKGFAWFFFKLMNVSGAEAVVAAASPWVGQGESACLVKPYVDIMTPSELHLVMTSGFSTISGSVLTAYIALVTSSVMSIPASIAISKMRIPEVEEPVTRGRIVVDRGDAGKNQPVNALHAFSLGGLFGLSVAGQILTNVLTILSLLVLGYIGYPIAFFLATKLIENEFAAYLELSSIQASSNPLSQRAFTIASYSLCGFANLGSLGIQIGVLGALAPSQGKVIAKLATSAMICGFISCVLVYPVFSLNTPNCWYRVSTCVVLVVTSRS